MVTMIGRQRSKSFLFERGVLLRGSLWALLCHVLLAISPTGKLITSVQAFEEQDEVDVFVNKVWPYHNPAESYLYYDVFTFCSPTELKFQPMTFGQTMRGDRLTNSRFQLRYMVDVPKTSICKGTLDYLSLEDFRAAINMSYMYEIYVDGLPVSRPLGIQTPFWDSHFLLMRHLHFNLGYNQGHVVSVSIDLPLPGPTADYQITPGGAVFPKTTYPVAVTPPAIGSDGFPIGFKDKSDDIYADITHISSHEFEFSYSVTWSYRPEIPVESRLLSQLQGPIHHATSGLDIHWLAIINSFVLVLLIVSLLVLIILKVVRSDLSKLLKIPDEEIAVGLEDESGWKLLHADVFRAPPDRMWFAACVACGAQLFLVSVTLMVMGSFVPYIERGAILSAGLLGYMITAYLAGFLSALIYRKIGGVKWTWNVVVTALMFVGPTFIIWSILNLIALIKTSTIALPFSTAAFLLACWLFVTLPLTVIGGIVGRQKATKVIEDGAAFPCKTNKLAREIPRVGWTGSPWVHMLLSGFLPFSAIYIELHYVFASVWGFKIYTLYGVLLLAFLLLLLVAVTVCVLLTYIHLNAEDHRWWWRSFASGGSVAIYFYLHSIYYFFTSTSMSGLLQVSYFFGYSLCVAWGLMLIMGSCTFFVTYCFIHYIYSRIKSD